MSDQARVAQLRAHRDTVADAWCQAMAGQDVMIRAKVFAYLHGGSYEAQMPTALIQAQEALLEALGDGGA